MPEQSQPGPATAQQDWTAWIVGGAALVVAVGALLFFIAGPTMSRQLGVGQVKRVAAAQLKDPSSAQFRNVARGRVAQVSYHYGVAAVAPCGARVAVYVRK